MQQLISIMKTKDAQRDPAGYKKLIKSKTPKYPFLKYAMKTWPIGCGVMSAYAAAVLPRGHLRK